jgi:murein L,D-transpeptidase YafK
MKQFAVRPKTLVLLAGTALLAVGLAACEDTGSTSAKATRKIPASTVALMNQKGVDEHSALLIRTYKKEAEFEVWKQKPDGTYTYIKTFPMCRWSGQLGPKLREGDRQVPEGFYTITPGQMNPNSNYYLSFNVGYPNAYDQAYGRTGGSIMVHGICSSAGCYSMTDAQIAEIYAIAREAFAGGQRAIQMQSFPFHMTAENLAKHRLDPNMPFWRNLKEGADHFEVSKTEPQVGVCSKRYVFDAHAPDGSTHFDASAPCPALKVDDQLASAVSAKQAKDEQEVAQLVASGVKPIRLIYQDGGQNPEFRNRVSEMSRPEALAESPTEIVLDDSGKPAKTPAVVQATNAKTTAKNTTLVASAAPATQAPATGIFSAFQTASATPNTSSFQPAPAASAKPFYKKWLPFGFDDAQDAAVDELATPQPANVPLPPVRASKLNQVAQAPN